MEREKNNFKKYVQFYCISFLHWFPHIILSSDHWYLDQYLCNKGKISLPLTVFRTIIVHIQSE